MVCIVLSIEYKQENIMANSVQILDKIARAATMMGLTVNSHTATQVIIDDGGDDILVTYQTADIASPMGGVSAAASPYLGIGTANPGYIVLSKNAVGDDTMATVFNTVQTAQVFAICCGFANDVAIMDGNEGVGTAAELIRVQNNVVAIGLGQ